MATFDIRGQLDALEIENFERRVFIPYKSVQKLFTKDVILSILSLSGIEFYDHKEIVRVVLDDGLRIFATLCLIGEPGSIKRFLEVDHFSRGHLDSKLPILDRLALNGVLDNDQTAQSFLRKQWIFLAPFFQADQSHRTLDEHTVLPFVSREIIGSGGFAKVYQVTVEASYQSISSTDNNVSKETRLVNLEIKA